MELYGYSQLINQELNVGLLTFTKIQIIGNYTLEFNPKSLKTKLHSINQL